MRKYISFISIFTLIVFIFHCNKEIRSYVESKNTPLKIYLEPTKVEIDIYFLRSISSLEVDKDKKEEIIKQVSKEHGEWFRNRLENILIEQGMEVVPKDQADLILESVILDMGEVRAKKFIEGLSVGLVIGAIIGELTGDPQVGFAEIIIVYLLKSYFMVTTIGLTVKQTDGTILGSKEFTSYSNKEYEKSLPEEIRNLRENKVRGSLEQNAKDIVEFLKKEENKK